MQEQLYRIHWQSKKNPDNKGYGNSEYYDCVEAKRVAERLNIDWPHFDHRVDLVSKEERVAE